MLIKAAINGGRSKSEHAAVPVTPEEQAVAVAECLKAGASVIHLHVRSTSALPQSEGSQSEKESLYAEDVTPTLRVLRAAVPNVQLGVSTGAWILPGAAVRFQAVAAWEILPDFASVNFSEEGAVELTELLLSRGVDVEAGLCDGDAAEVLIESGLAAACIRLLLEPQEQELARALEAVGAIEGVLDSAAIQVPRLLHGTEATVWPLMDEALARGYDIRVGLEDTLVLPSGRPVRDNAELVTEAARRARVIKQ